jgi:hypothetical protein
LFPRESQFESEPVAERAAVVPRGGRVLMVSQDLSNPIAKPGGGVFVLPNGSATATTERQHA